MNLYTVFNLKKLVVILSVFLFLLLSVVGESNAAITGAKDTITTSRPSASSPLNAALGATDTQATIFNNGSRYLASDSAKLIRTNSTNIIDVGTIVSSQSGGLTTVYFGEQTGVAGQAGIDVLFMPITAMHTIRLTIGTEIPDEGDLEIFFPTLSSGDADNDASPSASTFQFNNVVQGTGGRDNIEVYDDAASITSDVTVTETEPSAGSQGNLTFEFDNGPIAAGTVLTIMIGCSAASDSNTCTTQVPRIINPTKTAGLGSADSWKVLLTTQDASDATLESATVGIATIESVTVRATVDPTLTFTIAGLNTGTDIGNGNTGCNAGTFGVNTSSGINSTANEVNLGIIQNTPSAGTTPTNIAAQLITVTTNGSTGYALTATSSSSLLNPQTGYFFTTQTTPSYYAATSDFFGLHPCGNDVANVTWVEDASANDTCNFQVGNNGAADDCYWGWPNSTNNLGGGTTLSVANDTSGPVGTGTGETGDGLTSVAYSAGIDVLVPPGEYRAIITYIATPSF